ncbi:hypothetical protein IFR04_005116 [Cadophora malorum]|uniref:Uncharacterized protein n=1 Tax=Cadophora malorum TaxID=108018 RepID=A0A8H7THG9_9HELO|nr:hypothetical protein IFR04_005116 [Cadophora malorum]
MAGSLSPKDSSERLWPSPYSPTATVSTAKSVPQPTFVQTRNSIQSRPQKVRTQSPRPRGSTATQSPEMKSSETDAEGIEKGVRLWPSPYSKKPEEMNETGVVNSGLSEQAERDDELRERVEETPEPENVKDVEAQARKSSAWRKLLCFGCFR